MPHVAVVLSGCGVFDGSEIHEAVLGMYFLDRLGATLQCFAPDRNQTMVINHVDHSVMAGQTRNVMIEAARIARGQIKPLSALNIDEFDAAIFPGGFGAASVLSDYASRGDAMTVADDVLAFGQQFARAGKPMGFFCIAPVLIPAIVGRGVKVTVGHDAKVASALTQAGCEHMDANVDEIVIDDVHKVVTTPAYMLGKSMKEVAVGIEKCVQAVLKLIH